MKTAHWAKVAKAIGSKFGLNWKEARTAYRQLKENADRRPSLRMVAALPKREPAGLKGARKKQKAKTAPVASEEFVLPPGVLLAPQYERIGAREVPKRQGVRNNFEKALKEQNLPVAPIARNETGRKISKKWKERDGQQKLAKLLKQGHNQIKRDGWMKEQTKKRIVDLMEARFDVEPKNPMWNDILKQLYGVK